MSSSHPSKRLATAEDLLTLPEERAADVIGGELVDKAAPSPDHGNAQVGLSGALFGFRGPMGGGPRGPGGWWLMTEVEVFYQTHETYRHDVAGWRLWDLHGAKHGGGYLGRGLARSGIEATKGTKLANTLRVRVDRIPFDRASGEGSALIAELRTLLEI